MSEFTPFNRQKACRYGQMLYNVNDRYIGRSLDLYGEYSEAEVSIFRQVLERGQVVVEAGANIGAHTVFLAQQVGIEGMVLAFEPQRILFQTLCANLALNSITNTQCFLQALGDHQGKIIVPPLDYTQENNFGGIPLGTHEVGQRVVLSPLDSFQLRECHLLKIDVEGMECEVLVGARETIERLRPVLYVENDVSSKSNQLIRLIDSFGYCMYWHPPMYYNPDNFFRNPDNVFPNLCSRNMLCVHRDIPHSFSGLQAVELPPADTATTS